MKSKFQKRYVLVAIEAGADQVDANRLMRQVVEVLKPEWRAHATTVSVLPKALQS